MFCGPKLTPVHFADGSDGEIMPKAMFADLSSLPPSRQR